MTENEHLRAVVRQLSSCLTSLTPGGSEFLIRFDDDLYFADVGACEKFIRRCYDEGHKAKLDLARLKKKKDQLRD